MIRCIQPDCDRARKLARGGWTYPMCDAHTCEALTDAFGSSPRSWADRAATHTLPTSIVGGTDVTTARSALEPGVPTPLAPLVPSAERAAVAAPTG